MTTTKAPTALVARAIRRAKHSGAGRELKARIEARRAVTTVHGDVEEIDGRDYRLLRNRRDPDAIRRGFYYYGGCDLPALYVMSSHLQNNLRGTLAMHKAPGALSSVRSDRLVQLLEEGPRPDADELIDRLHLPPNYFATDLFEPTFRISWKGRPEFPKTVVALSGVADVIRPLYRRKSTGTLVDPGGWWLNRSPEQAMGDADTLDWFKREFKSIPRPTPDGFTETFGKVVRELKARVDPKAILVFSTLTVEPSDPSHNYQFRPKAEVVRRRRFRFAIQALAEREGFHVVDVDRVLKRAGIDDQLDFAHFPESSFPAVAEDAYNILVNAGVVEGG